MYSEAGGSINQNTLGCLFHSAQLHRGHKICAWFYPSDSINQNSLLWIFIQLY